MHDHLELPGCRHHILGHHRKAISPAVGLGASQKGAENQKGTI
jgi:hypothetical protein